MSDEKWIWHKDESYDVFKNFCTQVQNEKELKILKIISDHGGEFKNESFEIFCEKHGILQDFSCPRTPQQNGLLSEGIELYKKWLKS